MPDRVLAPAITAGRLLVISDYDGVVAPIVADPAAAWPDPAVKAALVDLAGLHRTYVAVLSGRERRSVTELLGPAPELTIVGSHGAESDEPLELPDKGAELLEVVIDEIRAIAEPVAGAHVETKPTSVALHVRNAEDEYRAELLDAVRRGPSTRTGVRTVEGKQVIELLVTAIDKGDAVEALRQRFAPDSIVVLGDDVTDEDAFAALGEGDIGIKVGPEDTVATARIDRQADVADVLSRLAEARHREVEPDAGATDRSG